MKILFLRIGETPNTDSRLLKEASFLVGEGHAVTTLGWVENSSKFIVEKNIHYNNQDICSKTVGIKQNYRFKYFKIWAFLKFEFFLFIWLVKHAKDFDAIHACNVHTGFVTAIISKIKSFYFVYDIFDYAPDTRCYPESYRKLVVAMENKAITSANYVILCSDKRKEQIGNVYLKNLAVIYNSPLGSAEKDQAQEVDVYNATKYKIVYVGGLMPYRCLPELLKVVQDNKNLELVVAGDGVYKNLFTDAASKNSRIQYLGAVPYSEVIRLEAQADIMVALYDPKLKNHVYASPNKFFEALKLGKPLVMIKGSGMSEWLTEQKFGELADPTSASIGFAINRLIEHKNNWICESDKMKKLYNSQFSWLKMEQKLRKIYSNYL